MKHHDEKENKKRGALNFVKNVNSRIENDFLAHKFKSFKSCIEINNTLISDTLVQKRAQTDKNKTVFLFLMSNIRFYMRKLPENHLVL